MSLKQENLSEHVTNPFKVLLETKINELNSFKLIKYGLVEDIYTSKNDNQDYKDIKLLSRKTFLIYSNKNKEEHSNLKITDNLFKKKLQQKLKFMSKHIVI